MALQWLYNSLPHSLQSSPLSLRVEAEITEDVT